jgi:ribosomal protein L11 methyltransferase
MTNVEFKMPAEWVDVCIQARVDAGELMGMLDDPTLQGAWEEEGTVHLYWPEAQWSRDRLASVRRALARLDGANGSQAGVVVNRVPHQDWNQEWSRSVKPLRIGRLVIRPSWEGVALGPHDLEIVLDPKRAFGTGHHATTRMLLEWLQDEVRGGERVLDVGTGSGILAMAALRLGAARAVGIDHDPVAIDCARGYAKTNGFGDELALHCGALTGVQAYDLVVANLDRPTLLDLADRLAHCTRSRLLVSGLLTDQRDEITAAFAAAGLYPGRHREQEEWLAMEFTSAQSCEGA